MKALASQFSTPKDAFYALGGRGGVCVWMWPGKMGKKSHVIFFVAPAYF